MNTTTSALVNKGILKPTGKISKDKINLVVEAVTPPFAEMVWVTTGGDMDTINRLTDILVSMNSPADRGKLFKVIQILYGLIGLQFSDEARRWAHTRRRWTTSCSLSRQTSGNVSKTISRTAFEPSHRTRRRSQKERRFFTPISKKGADEAMAVFRVEKNMPHTRIDGHEKHS